MWRTTAKKKKRKTKLVFNQFGCIDVGQPCGGKDSRCCSGVCDGDKPKKGKKDKSRCVAHDAQDCQPGADSCATGAISCGPNANQRFCQRTTGKASFCAANGEGLCFDCKNDAECREFCGPRAACIICDGNCATTGNRRCAGPDPDTCCLEDGDECTTRTTDCCSGSCKQLPSSPKFVCRAKDCVGNGGNCVSGTHSQCCGGACPSGSPGSIQQCFGAP
jgi:hypothetical protein